MAGQATGDVGHAKRVWGFTPQPNCDNCGGDGIFAEDATGTPTEPCTFCIGDAIKRGEIDGTIGGVKYVGGQVQQPGE